MNYLGSEEVKVATGSVLYEKVLLEMTYRNSWALDARVGRWTLDAGPWTLDATLRKLGSWH